MTNVMKDVEVVYHCVATAHEGLSVFSPVEITKNNNGTHINLAFPRQALLGLVGGPGFGKS